MAYTAANYFEQSLTLASKITGCVLVSIFASLIGISIGILSCPIGLKTCATAAGIKKFKSINS